LAFAGALPSSPALAQPRAAEGIHFELRAPSDCSSFEDFAAHVRKRSSRIALVPGPARRYLVVEIQQVGGSFRGSVRVVEEDGVTRDRQLKAASCAEAVEALSLIATVTLDPDAMLGEPEPEPEPEPPAKPPKALPKTPRVEPKQPAPPARPAREPYRFSVGLAATVFLNQAPKLAPGGSASLALEVHPGVLLSPLFRLSVTHVQRRDIAAAAGEANFAFTLPTLDVCPVRIGPPVLALRPCAFGRVGLLEAWGAEVAQREQHVRAYGELGGAIWAGLRVTKALEIIANGRAGSPLRRDKYGFDNRSFFTTPTLAFSAELGVAGGFP
jgi:hypothetical protein